MPTDAVPVLSAGECRVMRALIPVAVVFGAWRGWRAADLPEMEALLQYVWYAGTVIAAVMLLGYSHSFRRHWFLPAVTEATPPISRHPRVLKAVAVAGAVIASVASGYLGAWAAMMGLGTELPEFTGALLGACAAPLVLRFILWYVFGLRRMPPDRSAFGAT